MTATTTFQNMYTLVVGQSGFITIRTSGVSMWMGFFDWSSTSFPSLTCLAQSGNNYQTAPYSAPAVLGGGTQQISVNLYVPGSTPFYIQVKTLSTTTVTWTTMLFSQ
jgi:hypothetical protein